MQYQSIIRFFEYAQIDYSSAIDFNITRAKKLVNAEFAMQADGFITIDDFSYSKNDILAEMDRPDFSQRLEYHKRIWDQPSLLALLEHDRINLNEQPNWFHLAYASNFKAFISEYFAPVFDRNMRLLLSRNDLTAAGIWLNYFLFVEMTHEEEALRSTRVYLTEAIRFFKNLNDQSYKDRAGELYMWHNSHWSVFINKLPDSLLAYVDELISGIISFTVRIQNTDRKLCIAISQEMLLVNNANFTLKKLVVSNHEIYKKNYESRTVKGRLSNVNYIYVIIVVLFWVARIFMKDTSDNDNTFKYVDYKVNETVGAPVSQEVESPDNNAYMFQRHSYQKMYADQLKSGFNSKTATQLNSTAFAATKVYFFIEGHGSAPLHLDTLAFENLTNNDITVDMFWLGRVFHHKLEKGAYIGFCAAENKNTDFVLNFQSAEDSLKTTLPTEENNQYVHVRKAIENPSMDIEDEFGSPGELPYLLHSELHDLPVFVKVREDNGKIYFDMQSKASVLNAVTHVN